MAHSFSRIKRKSLEQRLAELGEEYDAVVAQQGRILDESARLRLERQAEHIATEIGKIETELESLGAEKVSHPAASTLPPATELPTLGLHFLSSETSTRRDAQTGLVITSYFWGSPIGLALENISIKLRFDQAAQHIQSALVGPGMVSAGCFTRKIYPDNQGYFFQTDHLPPTNRVKIDVISEREIRIVSMELLPASPPSRVTEKPDDDSPALLCLQLLRQGENEMTVRGVAVPGGGQPRATVPLPYTLTQLPAILKALDVGAYAPKRFKSAYVEALTDLGLLHENRLPPDFHVKVGQTLYQALFAGEIGDELRQAQRSGQPILCQLQFDPEDVILTQFPWELIHNTIHFCEMLDITVTRSVAFATPPPELKLTPPMRLLLISPRPKGEEALILQETAVQTGMAALMDAGQVAYQTLNPPTWAALTKKLRHEKFDIVHFDGHGSFARECPVCAIAHYPSQEKCVNCQADMRKAKPQGYLHFEDAQGELDRVNLSDMQTALAKSGAQMVFLSACRSGVTHGVSVFNGIAPALIRLGIPVVVAMQASPPDGSSTLFVQEFYESLVKEEKVKIEVAVGNGRRAIFRPQAGEPVSWFMPVVYLRKNG